MPENKPEPFKLVPGPLGRPDEQATTDAFVDYVGGRARADRLFNIYKNSHEHGEMSCLNPARTKAEVFRIRAHNVGFTDLEIDALLMLQ